MRFVVRAVAVVVGIAQLACGGGESPRPVEPQGPVVATIVVMAPPSPLQPGTTFALTAEVRDQSGVPIAGKALAWSSGNAAIATVSSTGVVTAEGPGTTAISATVDGKTGTANVSVAQAAVFAVAITPLPAPAVAGDTTPLAAVLTDRKGNVLVGRTITWSSSVTLVARVDGSGRLIAASPGATTVTAVSEGVSGTLGVLVTPPAGSVPPTIAAMTPATLTPGTTATVRGTGFGSIANTAVTVAGVAAAVLATTPTDITIGVPAAGLPCQSTQPVPVTVATVGGMATANQPLTVARARALAVGESFVTGASGDIACNELPAGGATW